MEQLDLQICQMPPEVLGRIFSLLSTQDRLQARQSCRYFKDICEDPKFWRKLFFSPLGQKEEESLRISNYMKHFGRKLKHLTISLRRWNWSFSIRPRQTVARERIVYAIVNLLQSEQAQLRSLTFHSHGCLRDLDEAYDSPTPRKEILTALCGMLERQKCLCAVTLTKFCLEDTEGDQLLLELFSPATAPRMTHVELDDFFHPDISGFSVDNCPGFLQVMGRFERLESLELPYQYLSNKVLTLLVVASPDLKRLILFLEIWRVKDLARPMPDWHSAMKKNRDLRLWVTLFRPGHHQSSSQLLMPLSVPTTGLSLDIIMTSGNSIRDDDRTETEIRNMSKCVNKSCVKVIILSLTQKTWSRPEALVELVKACPSLTLLCLDMTVTLDSLLQVAAAAGPRRGKEGGEERGPCVSPTMQIHVKRCETALERRDLERLRLGDNSRCTFHICDGCKPLVCMEAFI